MTNSWVLIIDYGSQVTQLIARRVRECSVYAEVVPYQKADAVLAAESASTIGAVILSGGPDSVLRDGSPQLPSDFASLDVPVLAICYGQQLLMHSGGGRIGAGESQEFGRATLRITQPNRLFPNAWNAAGQAQVWMSHGDHVDAIPDDYQVIGVSDGAPYAALAHRERPIFAVQFHPEISHTELGDQLIRNFVREIADIDANWTMGSFRQQAITDIRAQVGTGRVICGLSGGVDSAVAAALVHEAIGEQLHCIMIDHGLLRADEARDVEEMFRGHFNIPLSVVDSSALFLGALDDVVDPEVKRKTIGRLFIDEFQRVADTLGGADFLVQGTLYPDVIESVSFTGGPSVTIKSHHNVGGLPEQMNLDLVEPLRMLFKDEVRLLGQELGLPSSFIGRHPFPGPGLAIRIPGAVTAEKAEILRNADLVYINALKEAGLYDKIWQAFAALLPVQSVGVMGDARSYDYVCALRAVTSVDGMTADSYPFEPAFLSMVATRIVNQVKGINRVLYDVTSKPPATIEWE